MELSEKIAKLETIIPTLAPHNQTFAKDLVDGKWGFKAKGKLSEKQWFYVDKFIKSATAPVAAAPALAAPTYTVQRTLKLGDVSPIINLFDTAFASKLKKPALVVECQGTNIKLFKSTYGEAKGGVKVYNKDTGFWLGNILPDGSWVPTKALKENLQTALPALLIRLAMNPYKVTAECGQKTGKCCFCFLPLTDPKSTKHGWGPVCAKKWSLPWG